jgi:hypothetical protein
MKQRPGLWIAGAVLLTSIIAFVMRDTIRDAIILPLAYLMWLLDLYYRMVPQVILWAVLVVIVFRAAMKNLLLVRAPRETKKVKLKPVIGPVESLSLLLSKSGKGIYYKWLIANRLGKITREMLDQREGRQARKGFARLSGRDWFPPRVVEAYLESGLNGSFADYPQHRWSRPLPTPLDAAPQQIIDYLESELETGNDRYQKTI